MNISETLARAERAHRALAEMHAREAPLEELREDFDRLQPLHEKLVTALAARQPHNGAGLLLTRVRMDAEYRARRNDAEGVRDLREVWQHYAELHRQLAGKRPRALAGIGDRGVREQNGAARVEPQGKRLQSTSFVEVRSKSLKLVAPLWQPQKAWAKFGVADTSSFGGLAITSRATFT
jgi:hypothetical protein